MKMVVQHDYSKRQFLPVSFFYTLALVGLFLCMLLLANYNETPTGIIWNLRESDQSNLSNATSEVQETAKKNTNVDQGATYKTLKYFNKTNDKSDRKKTPTDTKYYGKDFGSDYITTKYIIHTFLNENGENLSPIQRAELVKERCQTFLKENNVRLNPNAEYRFDHEFMISRRYDNLAICYNCKVASTNIKRVLYALDSNVVDGINSLKGNETLAYGRELYTPFQQVMSDKHKFNVMIVREPLERLLSAYRNRRPYQFGIKYQPLLFRMYLQRILETKMKLLDRHIYPYFERCRPCEMQFDLIGLQNHFNEDIKIMLQKIGASGKLNIPDRNKTGYIKTSEEVLKLHFGEVPNDIIHRVWVKYYKDYYIFGFPYPTHLMN